MRPTPTATHPCAFLALQLASQFLRDPWGWVERELKRQQARAEQQRRGTPGGDYTDGDAYYEQQRRQQEWQQRQWSREWQRGRGGDGRTSGRSGGASAAGGADPLGYYRRLGVPPSASPQEISDSFRGLALKHHPDRAASEADKQAATKRFQASRVSARGCRSLGQQVWIPQA